MSLVEIVALLLSLAALFGYVNERFIKLPHTIGLVVISLLSSLTVIGLEVVMPGLDLADLTAETVRQLDFSDTFLNGMLAALLFAGALEVNFNHLRSQALPIFVLAVFGTLLSAVVIGFVTWYGFAAAGLAVPFAFCFLLGAIISPTDPIAVLGLLKVVKVPESLEAKITGESLFNDATGIVLFTVILSYTQSPQAGVDILKVLHLFLAEAGGGALLGGGLGYVAFAMLKSLPKRHRHRALGLMITCALAVSTYVLAQKLHLSGPIAVVVAGLLIGQTREKVMSPGSQGFITAFWEGIDEILNSILFLIIGFEVLVIAFSPHLALIGGVTILAGLLGRFVSVAVPIWTMAGNRPFSQGTIPILTIGGLRGGISVALALSLPESPYKSYLLAATYAIVIWTVVVQGLATKRIVQMYYPPEVEPTPATATH